MTDRAVKASGDATNDTILEPTRPRSTIGRPASANGGRHGWTARSDDERAAYARRVRQRRLAGTFDEGEQRIEETVRMGVHSGRETQLAAEGALALFYRWSRRTFAEFVRAGREWEEETSLPIRRRRVAAG